VKAPASIEPEEASRPTRDEDGGRCAFRATDGDAMFVGSCDTDETGSPHAEQKRAASEMPDPHFGQTVKMLEFYVARTDPPSPCPLPEWTRGGGESYFDGVGAGAGACPGGTAGVPIGRGPGVSPVFGVILDVFPVISGVQLLPSIEVEIS
jgi:hypothetical protein